MIKNLNRDKAIKILVVLAMVSLIAMFAGNMLGKFIYYILH